MKVHLFLIGAVKYRIPSTQGTALFSLLHREQMSPYDLKRCEKTGDVTFFLPRREAKRMDAALACGAVCASERVASGLPFLLARLSHRPGLILGIVLALALFVCAHLFVWELDITGNEEIDTKELELELAAAGLYRGAFLPTVDGDFVAFSLRRADGRIAYAAVNLSGTVARVQIREGEGEPNAPARLPANLVAKCDGVITLPLVFEGECLVREGEVVRKGQLLAAGVLDTQNHGYRITRAAGQVMARTTHVYTVTVPFFSTERYRTGAETHEISIFFFGFAQKVFKNTGKSIAECDIINDIQWLTMPSGRRLPLGVSVTTFAECAYAPVRYTAAEAQRLAQAQLAEQLAADSAGRTLLSRTVETRVDTKGVTLVCTVVCEEDIARVAEFDLTP